MVMKTVLMLLLVYSSLSAFTQIQEQSLWWNNTSIFNPAHTGAEYKHNVTSMNRFRSIKTFSQGQAFSAVCETRIFDKSESKFKTAIGVNFLTNNLFRFNSSRYRDSFMLNIAEHFEIKEDYTISAGVALGRDFSSPLSSSLDTLNSKFRLSNLNYNAGILMKLNELHLGAGVTGLNNEPTSAGSNLGIKPIYNFQARYKLKIRSSTALIPAVNVFLFENNTFTQANASFMFNDNFTFGFSYSSNESVGINLGSQLGSKVHLNYALQNFYNSSFSNPFINEFSIAYRIKS